MAISEHSESVSRDGSIRRGLLHDAGSSNGIRGFREEVRPVAILARRSARKDDRALWQLGVSGERSPNLCGHDGFTGTGWSFDYNHLFGSYPALLEER